MFITIISGSPRKQSSTKRVAMHLHQWLTLHTEHAIQWVNMQEWNLPPMENVFAHIDEVPAIYRPLAEMIFQTDAFILVSPEYNGSYSPAMKNMLDHFPKQTHKAFGVVTATTGALGGMRAAQQLLQLVPALFGIALPQLLLVPQVEKKFDEKGMLTDPSFQKNRDAFLTEFLWLSERLHTNSPIEVNSMN